MQEPAIIALYLSPQTSKPTDANEPKRLTDLVRDTMQLCYSAGLNRAQADVALKVNRTFLFA